MIHGSVTPYILSIFRDMSILNLNTRTHTRVCPYV